ncbi:clusterin [Gasterosteus aculeatus]|uniref:Clusterin n=1 Tax=Gasterosteus aculeatus aculeatus TaxID=481459 RepID=G3NXP9_GASAC|nr:clusterin [Gasterosteus aculeatus aculeatus]
MLMMMMMMKKKGSKSLAVMALLLASANCILPLSKEDLNQISLQGEKYLDKQIVAAVNGVKEMKSVMQKSSEDHQKFVDTLEKTKEQKEEAIRVAQEMEAKLEQQQEVCNETMRALWEECKPCLKNTCVKYYSRTCSSGSGLVGRQLEEVLNRTSPMSIWITGENVDVLEQEGQRQSKEFKNLEDKYTEMADGVDSIFSDSMKVADHLHHDPPGFFFPNFLGPTRSIRSLFQDPFHGFQNLFSPMMGMGKNFLSSVGSMMDIDSDTAPNEDGSVNEDVVITKPFGDGRMTCREIRRNSAGCFRFREECQKCKDIQHIDCSGNRPLEGPLKEELEEALAIAERFSQQYNSLLETFKQQMFDTSSILDQLNREFGWVSSLNNKTTDDVFRVQMVNSTNTDEKNHPGETNVSVQLFDSPPLKFSVPGEIPWNDPKFSEVVAQEALDRYKESSVLVK